MKEMREREMSVPFFFSSPFFFFFKAGTVNTERGNAFKLRSLNSLAGGIY